MDGPGQPGGSDESDGAGPEEGAADGEPAGAGARSGGSDSGTSDDTVEGEFKEVRPT
jgi:hypothetical protein